jgi:hypothetical protein
MNSGRLMKIFFVLTLFFVSSPILLARVEFKPSPLFNAVSVGNKSDEFDDFGDEDNTKKKTETKKPELQKSENGDKHVSRTKAVLLSLIFPGAGHYYAGEKGRAEVFAGAEVATWIGVLAFNTYGNWKKDDYINLAQTHAGVNPTGQDEEFYKNLAFYENRNDYNTAGRIINPDAPYYPNTRAYNWQWDDAASRKEYRSVRNSSKSAFRKATFMIGVAVFNRIIAGIDTFRILRKIGTQVKEDEFSSKGEGIKFKVKGSPFGENRGVTLAISHRF